MGCMGNNMISSIEKKKEDTNQHNDIIIVS